MAFPAISWGACPYQMTSPPAQPCSPSLRTPRLLLRLASVKQEGHLWQWPSKLRSRPRRWRLPLLRLTMMVHKAGRLDALPHRLRLHRRCCPPHRLPGQRAAQRAGAKYAGLPMRADLKSCWTAIQIWRNPLLKSRHSRRVHHLAHRVSRRASPLHPSRSPRAFGQGVA